MKTKILFIITKSNFGGAQKYVYDIATNLPVEKFDVTVAVGGSGILIQKLTNAHIRTIPISSLVRDVKTKNDLSAFFELWTLFRKERPDIVHLNSAKAGGVGALAGRLAGIPQIIFTAHGWAFNERRPSIQRAIIQFFSWITVMLAHTTIAVSDAVKNNTQKWPWVDRKIMVIKNGVREPDFYTKEEARTKLFAYTNTILPSSAFIVGTIAELHKNKGLSYAIEAFAELTPPDPNLFYFILGGGEEKERLDALVKLRKLEGRVFLLGFVDDAARFLTAFDIFLLPSLTEGLALVVLEAGLARLPIIATNVGGLPEIIKHNETGLLVPSCDPQAIAESLKTLQKNTLLREHLGQKIRARIEDEFPFKNTLTQTMSLYKRG